MVRLPPFFLGIVNSLYLLAGDFTYKTYARADGEKSRSAATSCRVDADFRALRWDICVGVGEGPVSTPTRIAR